MVPIGQGVRRVGERFFALYRGHSARELIVCALGFVIGFAWPVAGVAAFVASRSTRRFKDAGTIALIAAIANIVVYLLQIVFRIVGALA